MKKIHLQIGQVQKSLESCMDKQTIEFQTQVQQLTKLLFVLQLPKRYQFASGNVGHFTNDLFLQVAGIKSAISLKEKVCKIMNKTYGRCFRSLMRSV